MNDHNPPPKYDRSVDIKSNALKDKTVAVAVCGGIGAVEIVKIIRELRRHGARVTAFFTPSTERFITRLSVEWATESPVVVEAGADVTHLNNYDVVVVAPATLNTISKSALGLADNVVTLLVASQLGRKGKLVFIPTMYLQLKDHPLYAGYVAKLQSWGARFIEVAAEEGRQKMPTPEVVASAVAELI